MIIFSEPWVDLPVDSARVRMVRHKQPASLYSLTHTWVCCYIGDRLVNTGYDSPAQQTLATVRLVISVIPVIC